MSVSATFELDEVRCMDKAACRVFILFYSLLLLLCYLAVHVQCTNVSFLRAASFETSGPNRGTGPRDQGNSEMDKGLKKK